MSSTSILFASRKRASRERAGYTLAHYRAALDLAIDLDQRVDQIRAHDGFARTHLALGHEDPARQHWQAALNILTTLGLERTYDPQVATEAILGRPADLGQ